MENDAQDIGRLKDEAIALVIRMQADPACDVTQALIRTWRMRSPMHEKVWQRMIGVHDVAGQLLAQGDRRDGIGRRQVLVGGIAALGAVALGAEVVPPMILRARADHSTAKGQTDRVTLPDGSTVLLGAASAIALDFAATRRRVAVLEGSVYVLVASRLTVGADWLTVTAQDAAFEVTHQAGNRGVAVERGQISAIIGTNDAVLLNEGDWLLSSDTGAEVERGADGANRVASWRGGVLIADDEPVALLVRRIAAWIPGRVAFADPFIGTKRVSGVFDLTQPDRALAAALHPTGASARRLSPYLTVISPI